MSKDGKEIINERHVVDDDFIIERETVTKTV